jgi:hypothetical protein
MPGPHHYKMIVSGRDLVFSSAEIAAQPMISAD